VDEINQQDLGYECLPILLNHDWNVPFYRINDTLYYLSTASESSTISTLASFNVRTKTINRLIYTGEIESIVGLSPDEKYIVFLLDDNGILDFPWRPMACCDGSYNYQLVILEVERQHIVYVSEPIGVYSAAQVHWIDSRTLAVFASNTIHSHSATDEGYTLQYGLPASIRRIAFGETIAVSITNAYSVNPYIDPSLQGHYFITEDQQLIDFCTFEPVPIFRDDIPETYLIWFDFDNDGLQVNVQERDNYSNSVTYRVTLNDADC
jgi:hypothetical protein